MTSTYPHRLGKWERSSCNLCLVKEESHRLDCPQSWGVTGSYLSHSLFSGLGSSREKVPPPLTILPRVANFYLARFTRGKCGMSPFDFLGWRWVEFVRITIGRYIPSWCFHPWKFLWAAEKSSVNRQFCLVTKENSASAGYRRETYLGLFSNTADFLFTSRSEIKINYLSCLL